jgi:hypothetical protein
MVSAQGVSAAPNNDIHANSLRVVTVQRVRQFLAASMLHRVSAVGGDSYAFASFGAIEGLCNQLLWVVRLFCLYDVTLRRTGSCPTLAHSALLQTLACLKGECKQAHAACYEPPRVMEVVYDGAGRRVGVQIEGTLHLMWFSVLYNFHTNHRSWVCGWRGSCWLG